MNAQTGRQESYWIINGETLRLEQVENSFDMAKLSAQEMVVKYGRPMTVAKVVAGYVVKAEPILL